MRRSGQLSGATVALELLPREIGEAGQGPLVALLCEGPDMGAIRPDAGFAGPPSALFLVAGENSLPLSTLLPFAEMPPEGACLPATGEDDLASGNLRAALGNMIAALIASKGADLRALYRLSLVLAMLIRNREAHATLSLLDVRSMGHPAFLALRGYLALQTGEVDTGRRFLASAALASRGSPANRGILHFTQHVLLVHQFNG